jgi:hypothetical protein
MSDRDAIEAVVRTYLDGLHEGDADKLASAFHPTSALTQWWEGELRIVPRDVWLDAVRNRPSPKAQGLARADEIISIEQHGPEMAVATLRCAIPPRYFTDLLSLLKIDGRWQVAQKVFRTEIRG